MAQAQRDGASENRIFLYFMGELLRVASIMQPALGYEDFESALLHFDQWQAEFELTRTDANVLSRISDDAAQQLRLFEKDENAFITD